MENVLERNPMIEELNELLDFKSLHSKKQIFTAQSALGQETGEMPNACQQMEVLKSHILNAPVVDEKKVSYFKAELQSGRYQISDDKIASRLFALEPV